jgi:hypothetical protein
MAHGIEILIRLATGDAVSAIEAREALASDTDERTARHQIRNRALSNAAEILSADDPGAWRIAERLCAAVLRFETRIKPRLDAGAAIDLAPVDRQLHRAFLSGIRVPRTQRRLVRFC